jgi:hypothetical protein
MRTREEHLEWCKQRAREYLDKGELLNAVASMGSDLDQHRELGCNHFVGLAGVLHAQQGDREAVLRWIEGFR